MTFLKEQKKKTHFLDDIMLLDGAQMAFEKPRIDWRTVLLDKNWKVEYLN